MTATMDDTRIAETERELTHLALYAKAGARVEVDPSVLLTLIAALTSARSENEALRKALAPFAHEAVALGDLYKDPCPMLAARPSRMTA